MELIRIFDIHGIGSICAAVFLPGSNGTLRSHWGRAIAHLGSSLDAPLFFRDPQGFPRIQHWHYYQQAYQVPPEPMFFNIISGYGDTF